MGPVPTTWMGTASSFWTGGGGGALGGGRPEDLLALRGYRFEEEYPDARPDPGLLALAEEILRRWDEVQTSWEASPLVRRFLKFWKKRFGQAFPRSAFPGSRGFPWSTRSTAT